MAMRVFHFNSNGDAVDVGLKMRIENEGHRVDNAAPNPDCIIAENKEIKSDTPTFGGGSWACSINRSSDYATTVLKTLGIKNEKVNNGIRITIEAWYNGKSIQGVNYSMTDYPLMEGGKGPVTSGMGSVVWEGRADSRLFKATLGKLEGALEKVDYRGVIHMDLLVGDRQLLVHSIHAGINWNTFPVLAEMYHGRINDLLYGIASGVDKPMKFKSVIGVGVMLKMYMPRPPVKIEGLNKHNLKHFWMDDPECINTGRLGVVTARGDEIQGFSALRDAKRRVMRTIYNLTIPEVMFRQDVGNKVEKNRAQLKTWGWL